MYFASCEIKLTSESELFRNKRFAVNAPRTFGKNKGPYVSCSLGTNTILPLTLVYCESPIPSLSSFHPAFIANALAESSEIPRGKWITCVGDV